MITPETMILVCEYVRRGCQVSEAANTGYMKILDVELSDFNDDDFWAAARAIVRNETLYGKFPAVALWRKYSPAEKQAQITARNFTGVDPENPNFGYPIPLTLTFGVNLSF